MPIMDSIRKLILNSKLKEAAKELELALGKQKENPELWYLRGVCSLKLNNYNYAQECFDYALSFAQKAGYYKMKGIAHLESLQLEDAAENFQQASRLDSKDPENYFFIGVCLMLTDNPLAKEYIQKAYLRDRKKTKKLLSEFYSSFIGKDFSVSKGTRTDLLKRLSKIN